MVITKDGGAPKRPELLSGLTTKFLIVYDERGRWLVGKGVVVQVHLQPPPSAGVLPKSYFNFNLVSE